MAKLKIKNNTIYYFIVLLVASIIFIVPVLQKGINDSSSSLMFYVGVIGVLALTRNMWVLLFYFLILALNGYMLYVPCAFLGVTVTAIVYIYSYFCLFVLLIKHKFFRKLRKGFISSFIIYFILTLAVLSINGYVNGTGVGTMIWSLSPLVMSLAIVIALNDDPKLGNIFIISIIIASLISTMVAYVELIQGSTFFYHLWTNNGERFRNGIMRVGSTLGDPNTLAEYIVPCIFLLLTNRVKNILGEKTAIILSGAMVLMVILTSSRTSLLAMCVGGIIWFYYTGKSWKQILAIFTVFLAIALMPILASKFYTADVASSGQRIMLVFKALDMWKQNILFGIGLDNFMKATYWMTMNEYARQLVEIGIFGFLLYIFFYYYLGRVFFYSIKKMNRVEKEDASLIIAAVVAFAINSLSMDSYYNYVMWILPPLCFMFFKLNNREGATIR